MSAPAAGTEAHVVAGINTHGACVVRFVKTAAGNNGVWAGGAQVILTANEGTSPDVGPRALKIRSKISDFVATNNATIAAVGIGLFGNIAPRLAAATRAWATYMEKHGEICHPPITISGVTIPGYSRTGGAAPADDTAAAIAPDRWRHQGQNQWEDCSPGCHTSTGRCSSSLRRTTIHSFWLSSDLWFDLLEADHKTAGAPLGQGMTPTDQGDGLVNCTGLCLDPLKMTSLPSTTVDFKQDRMGAGELWPRQLLLVPGYNAVATETEFYAASRCWSHVQCRCCSQSSGWWMASLFRTTLLRTPPLTRQWWMLV